jgi:hypothetical protein
MRWPIVNWPWSKTRRYPCPDGTVREVYKNIDHAFPLYIAISENIAKGKVGGVDMGGTTTIGTVEASSEHKSKVEGVLYSINEQNQSLMIALRTAYTIYSSSPCTKSDFLERTVEKLLDEQARLSKVVTQCAFFIELVKNHPESSAQILSIYQGLVQQLTSDMIPGTVSELISDAAAKEIEETRRAAEQWKQKKQDRRKNHDA